MDDDLDLGDFDGLTRLFPLAGVVLFPHVVLPLHIFEPRYRQMTEHALADDRRITIIQIRHPATEIEMNPELESIGCLGRIIRHQWLPDGRFNLFLLGCARVRIVREIFGGTLYRQAEVEVLDDIGPIEPASATADELVSLYRALPESQRMAGQDLANLLSSRPSLGVLTDLLAHSLPFPGAIKQIILDQRHIGLRSEDLKGMLQLHALAMETRSARRPYPPSPSLN